MAKLSFLGAVKGVTGSAYLLETDRANLLLDCGLVQGSRDEEKENQQPFPFDTSRLDAVILSHAHLDHSGRIPKLISDGCNVPVYMTYATAELLEILLKDAAFLQQRDAEWENKRRRRAGKAEVVPLYTIEDTEQALHLCQGVPYGQRQQVADGVDICFRDAGHILGSAIVEIFIDEAGIEKKLVFSGDLGNSCSALLRDPTIITDANILMLESTYGNREHRSMQDTLDEFEQIIMDASETGGNILIPSFAVGRTQEVIFHLGELYQAGKLKQQAVYLDSPMAIATTEVYHRYQHVYNEEDGSAISREKGGSLHSFLPVLRYSQTTEESIALNRIAEGAIIIAGSGMCNGGRIRHHLKHNLWRRNAHVIFVGFQAMGTPGRALVDGAKTFNMAGEKIVVNAAIHTLGGFSAHASQSQLLDWAMHFNEPRPRLYLVHGDQEAKIELQKKFLQRNWSAEIPSHGQTVSF